MKKILFTLTFITTMLLCTTAIHAQGLYKNSTYDYSLAIPDSVYAISSLSSSSTDEDNITFRSSDGLLTAVINSEKADASSILAMRKYLNDYASPDDIIFDKLSELKESYIDALNEVYRNDYLFGGSEKILNETNIKVIKQYTEQLFGVRSSAVLYNEISSNIDDSSEVTHVTITIPYSANKTIYTLHFSVKRGFLSPDVLMVMSQMLDSLKIANRTGQAANLKLFSDVEAIKTANLGIYPNLRTITTSYSDYVNAESGYRLTYPSVFMPYHQNNLIRSFDYKSFKINYFHHFNITVQPALDNSNAALDKINALKQTEKFGTVITDSGIRKYNDNEFYFAKYSLKDNNNEVSYLQDYYINHSGYLYRIQLSSRYIRPSFMIESEFMKIIHSFQFIEKARENNSSSPALQKFVNPEEGYTFSYPMGWSVSSNASLDINYNLYYVKNTDFSGPLDIYISEGELKQNVSALDIKELANEFTLYDHEKLFRKYYAPYSGKANKILATNISFREDAVYLFKLVNYLDGNNRVRLGYSVDIIRDKRVASLFISVGEYITSEGRISDTNIASAINLISSSFSTEKTPEFLDRMLRGEARNKKVVAIESYVKSLVGESATVSSAVYVNNVKDILVKVTNTEAGGYYKITAGDPAKNEFAVTGQLLFKDIFEIVRKDLLSKYSGKYIDEIDFYSSDMTIDLEYRNDEYSQSNRDTYSITVDVLNNQMVCKLIKKP